MQPHHSPSENPRSTSPFLVCAHRVSSCCATVTVKGPAQTLTPANAADTIPCTSAFDQPGISVLAVLVRTLYTNVPRVRPDFSFAHSSTSRRAVSWVRVQMDLTETLRFRAIARTALHPCALPSPDVSPRPPE